MVLCVVPPSPRPQPTPGRYDGVLGDRERGAGTYREFVAAQKRSLSAETWGS